MFEGFDSLKDQCFADVTAGSVAVLLSFGDAIAKSKRSPEKLFVLLDMYEIMRELHSEVCSTIFNMPFPYASYIVYIFCWLHSISVCFCKLSFKLLCNMMEYKSWIRNAVQSDGI